MSEEYIPKFISAVEFQDSLELLLKGRLLNEFILHFYYAAEYNIDSQFTGDDILEHYQELSKDSETKLKAIASKYFFEEKMTTILLEADDYKYYSFRDADIFETIFLRDLEIAQNDFCLSFVESLKGFRFASDLVSFQHKEFIFHLCRYGLIKNRTESIYQQPRYHYFDEMIRDRIQVLELYIFNKIKDPVFGDKYWTLIYENKPELFIKISVIPGKSDELAHRLHYFIKNLSHELFLFDSNRYGNFSEFYWSILRGGIFNGEKKFRFVIAKKHTNLLLKKFNSYFVKTDKNPNSNNLTALLNSNILEYSDGTIITADKIRGNKSGSVRLDNVERNIRTSFEEDIKVISEKLIIRLNPLPRP